MTKRLINLYLQLVSEYNDCPVGSVDLLIKIENVRLLIENKMDKDQSQELKQLILTEIAFRKEFREAREKLESLVSPITKHNRECCNWWSKNLPNVEEVLVIMDNGTSLKLVKPKLERCAVESYLPYGIDFTECPVINVSDY
jgi:hypothetical protein